MRVNLVLLRRMKNLGNAGSVCSVRMGYANYLLRENCALRATQDNISFFQAQKENFLKKDQDLLSRAQGIALSLKGCKLRVIRSAGNTGKLYGSVSAKDLVDMLAKEGIDGVTSSMILLRKLIKTTGVHAFEVQLHPDVDVNMSVIVARTEGEAIDFEKSMTKKAPSVSTSDTDSETNEVKTAKSLSPGESAAETVSSEAPEV